MTSIFRKDLLAHLEIQTQRAIENGHVKWTESEVVHLPATDFGLAYEITFAPQLGQKPTAPKDKTEVKPANPFLPPYPPDAFVAEGRDDEENEEFVILLNKFMVARRHCLVVTRNFEPQASPPSPAMMKAAYQVLRSFALQGSSFQAIYNCGSESGASQRHRHLQLVPLQRGESPMGALLDAHKEQTDNGVFSLPQLPYANFAYKVDASTHLGDVLILLLNAMHQYFVYSPHGRPRGLSYNLILSTSCLLLVPRSVSEAELATGISPLSVNAMAFSGCVLVKDEHQLREVRELGSEGLLNLLGRCGFAPLPRPPHQDADLEEDS